MNAAIVCGITQDHVINIGNIDPNNGSERHYLQFEAAQAFLNMQHAAALDGVDCQILSSYRSFAQQQSIWDRKWHGQLPILDNNDAVINPGTLSNEDKLHAILRWSALPGTSRHHWGTDFDVVDRQSILNVNHSLKLVASEYEPDGICGELTTWLKANANHFGFEQPYAHDNGGIGIEPWHYSYTPLAHKLQPYLTLKLLTSTIHNSDIAGKETVLMHLPTIFERYYQ